MDKLALFTLLATLTESTAEFLFGSIELLKTWMPYIALGIGVLVSIAYRLDILNALFGVSAPEPYVGWIVTGLIIGRGSSWLHDFVGRWISPPKP